MESWVLMGRKWAKKFGDSENIYVAIDLSHNAMPSYQRSKSCNSFLFRILRRHLNHLLNTLILRQIQLIFLRHLLTQKPATHKMPSFKPFHQRLRRRQTDQRIRVIALTRSLIRWSSFNVPATGCIDSQDRNLCVAESGDDGGEGLADLAAETEAKDCVDDDVGFLEGGVEVGCEVYAKLVQLLRQSLGLPLATLSLTRQSHHLTHLAMERQQNSPHTAHSLASSDNTQ